MLTRKQKQKLTVMTTRYAVAMNKHTNIHGDLLGSWVLRYKAAMSRVLQRQGKR